MEWGRGKELGETGRGEVTNWVELPPPEAVSAVAVPREEKDADGCWLVGGELVLAPTTENVS
jgi:hypothetical protein